MRDRIVEPTEGMTALADALPALASRNPYRHHRLFTPAEQQAIVRHGIERQLASTGQVTRMLVRDGQLLGICSIAPLSWDTAHFGLPMGRLDCQVAPVAEEPALRHLLATTLDAASQLGLQHLSTHIDIDDYALLHALTAGGFRLMDAKRTFIARRHPRSDRGSRIVLPARPFHEDDRAQVEALAQSVVFASRFTRDAWLDQRRGADLYGLWMKRLLDTPADQRTLQVVERRGRIVACGGVIEVNFAAAGVPKRILADGVFACTPEGTGSYLSVIDALIAEGIARYPLLETRVSQNNLAAVRVLEYLGYSTAASQYALHLHIQR